MRRRDILAALAAVPLAPVLARSQPAEPKLVGALGLAEEGLPFFVQGLADVGWIAEQDLIVERPVGATTRDELRAQAGQLVATDPDALYGSTTPPTLALLEATSEIPIVFSNTADPVGSGIVGNLARPEGNATGFMFAPETWIPKMVEFLLLAKPDTTRIGLLHDAITLPVSIDAFQRAAGSLSVEPILLQAFDDADYSAALSPLSRLAGSALVVDLSPLLWLNRQLVVEAVLAADLAAIYSWPEYVELGGLLAYGPDGYAPIRDAGRYVGRILNGERISSLPVQASTKFDLTLNISAARRQGIVFPADLLVIAEEVIE